MIDKNGDYFCRVSRKIYWKVYLFFLVCTGFIIASYAYGIQPGKYVLISFGVTLVIGTKVTEAHRLIHSYKITHHHLLHTHGLVSRKVKKILLSSVGDFQVDQTFWQRIFNMGDISIYHYGNDHSMKISNIGRPKEFADYFQNKLLIAKGALVAH
jgi:uncharacterized membrane protein YdbT with pleckstrin-like domain